MMNAECRMEAKRISILHSAFIILHFPKEQISPVVRQHLRLQCSSPLLSGLKAAILRPISIGTGIDLAWHRRREGVGTINAKEGDQDDGPEARSRDAYAR
jgi:hypothetical protein